ncbi:MAG: hypothetical protein M1834_003276 [Cirrosporium novae-zelandiae]|nr:MAG: hypothetical protein M1834_003276 [Cirrosporium novae-zelandiae]
MDCFYPTSRSVPSLCSSPSSSSRSSSPSSAKTPATERSVIFGDHDLPFFDSLLHDDRYILVLGGLGYIGGHTTVELLKAGYNVIVIDNLSNSYRDVLDRIHLLRDRYYQGKAGAAPALDFYDIDYQDIPTMESIIEKYDRPSTWDSEHGPRRSKITGVIHFAAFKSVEESIANPLRYYSNNVCGMVDLLGLLGDHGIKTFIFSSSATVYGTLANSGKPIREEFCVHKPETFEDEDGVVQTQETGSTGITNPYGRTKWMCEAILSDLAAADPDWTIVALRYFNPVGCDESGILTEEPKGKPSNLMPLVVKTMQGEMEALQVFGANWETKDGTAVRDFIHVSDLARGHITALTSANEGRIHQPFRTFNLGTGCGHSVREVVDAMETASSKKIATRVVGRREGDVGYCVARATRAHEELRWKTEKSLKDCCVDILNCLKLRSH